MHPLIRQGMPVPVDFAGMHSNTARLGRMGWQVAVHEDHYSQGLQLMLHHPVFRLTLRGMANNYTLLKGIARGEYNPEAMPPITVNQVIYDDQYVQYVDTALLADHVRVDTRPSVTHYQNVRSRFGDLPFFAELFAPRPEAQQLIVAPDEVQLYLDAILKMQEKGRKAIRARERGREVEQAHVHAQVISLRAA